MQQGMDLELKELNQFSGKENYYKVLGANVTDGIGYIMENGYSWLVTDFIVVAKMLPELKKEEFLCIEFKLKDSQGIMIVTDGNDKVLYIQEYKYTNVKRELKLFFTDNVLMLAGEY